MNSHQRKVRADERARQHAYNVAQVREEIEAPLRAVIAAFEVQLDEQTATIADLRRDLVVARGVAEAYQGEMFKATTEIDLLRAFNHDHLAELARLREEITALNAQEKDAAKLRRRLASAHAERDDERAKRRLAEAVIRAQSEVVLVGKDDAKAVIRRAEVIAAGEP
jgi:chromosome segregation ATPase